MRIGLRILYSQGWLGGVNYVLNIARMLNRLPQEERPEIVFLTTAPESAAIAEANSGLATQIVPLSEARHLDLDFVYPSTQLAEAPYGVAWGGWIPDWQCRHYPELFPDEERSRRFLQYRALARRPVVCVFSSQQAIADTVSQFGAPKDNRYHIFHFPAVFDDADWSRSPEQLGATRRRHGIPDNYFIVCNQFWKHKNHLVIAEALAERPDLDLHVVMTGELQDTRWPEYTKDIRALLNRRDVASRITITGSLAREDQLDLLFGATGIIQPSRFEGWSTFVEEARAIGLPGLLSDIPVHREQAPTGMTFFDPDEVHSLTTALEEFLAAAPARPSLADACKASEALIVNRARTFLSIARDARQRYDAERHDTVPILASEILAVHEEGQNGSEIGQGDFDRFLAGIRLALRDHPEDLARLAGRLCDPDTPFGPLAQNLVILATLAKAPQPIRDRFLAYDPAQDGIPTATSDVVKSSQLHAGKPDVQLQTNVANILFRVRDYVRRKLPV